MTQLQAVLVAVGAGSLIVAGVALLAGLPWALICAGVLLALAAVLLYDPQKSAPKQVGRKR